MTLNPFGHMTDQQRRDLWKLLETMNLLQLIELNLIVAYNLSDTRKHQ